MNGLSPFTLMHVCGVVIGVFAGALAMVFRKGSGLHRAAGTVFFVSMLAGAGAGMILSAFIHPRNGNLVGSSLTFYLVSTAWVAARRRDNTVSVFDWIAMFGAFAIAMAAYRWGIRESSGFYFVFGTIAFLFAASDVRMLVRGGVAGGQRIARHLFRMCLALLFALMSAYPGQAKLLPPGSRSGIFVVPHLLLIGALIFWLRRARGSREGVRGRAAEAVIVKQ